MPAIDAQVELSPSAIAQPPALLPRPAPPTLRAASAAPRPLLCWLFLGAWCGFLFFIGLHAGQLWKTESLRAIIAAEFLRSGNWIVPTLYGEPLFTKPPGMYAAIAFLSLPLGQVTEWTARLPSALAAALTVLMLYGYFSRGFGRRAGLLIAVLAPMSPLWLDKATAAEIDMMQVMWVTGSILCLLRALEGENGIVSSGRGETRVGQWALSSGRWTVKDGQSTVEEKKLGPPPDAPAPLPAQVPLPSFQWWLAALLCVAGGVLTKWTAPAFYYATAIPLLWWRGQLRLLFSWRHIAAAAVGASICFAWIGAAVALEGWDVFFDTVKREALQRMLPDHSPSPDPWHVAVMHPLRLWYINLPWSLAALVACWPGFGKLLDWRGRLLWQAAHCWIWPNVLIWSLMVDHKPRHSFPLFPGFACLAALVWLAWLDGRLRWPWRVQPKRILVMAMVCWLIAKSVFVHLDANRHHLRDPRGKAAILAALIPEESILYLFHLKDEGIMFYYGRTVRRLPSPRELPSSSEPLYCILAKEEWEGWQRTPARPAVALTGADFKDEQGASIVLVRVN